MRLNNTILTIGLSLLVAISFAQVNFSVDQLELSHTISRNGIIDMNADHLDDVVAVGDRVISIFYQQADGTLEVKRVWIDLATKPYWSIAGADIDGNGFNDLCFGATESASFIMTGNNGAVFEELLLEEDVFAQRNSFADIDNDGHLDAFICNDVGKNLVYRNDGNGNLILDNTLIETADLAGNYACTWTDYDNDNDIDLYITKCVLSGMPGDPSRTNLLYQNDGQGNFSEVGAVAGMDDNDQSWVTHFEDYDNDGDFDAFILNHEQANKFMLNNGDGTFTDIIGQVGISPSDFGVRESLSADFDNNGFMDIIIDFPFKIYYNNGDMTFTAVETDVISGALGDLNNDGFLDVHSSNRIWYNEGNENHWIKVNTVGRESNRNGIGARVELFGAWGMMTREVRATQSYSPMNSLETHFGIGTYESIDSLKVKWPSGRITVVSSPAIDQMIVVDETNCPVDIIPVAVSGSTELCPGETVTLSLATVDDILWSNGETGSSITISTSGNYNATVTDSNGCTSLSQSTSVLSLEDPIQIQAYEGVDFCGTTPIPLVVDLPDGYEVTWSDGSTGNNLYTNIPGEYIATITSSCNEVFNSEPIVLTQEIVEPPVVEDVAVSAGYGFVNLNAVGGDYILWVNSSGGIYNVGNDLLLSEEFVMSDTVFYVQACIEFQGRQCCSELTPINLFYTSSNNELNNLSGVTIYPNPSSDRIFIQTESQSDIMSAKLLGIDGQLVYKIDLATNNSFDVTGIDAGVYMLEVSQGDKSYYERVVINR